MSLQSFPDVKRVLLANSKISFPESEYAILKQFSTQNQQVLPANSSTNTVTTWQPNVNPLSLWTRRAQMKYFFETTITCNDATDVSSNGLCYDPQFSCPAAYPIAKMSNFTIQLNNTTLTMNIAQYITYLPWMGLSLDQYRYKLSKVPSFLDQTSLFSVIYNVGFTAGVPNSTQLGTANSPMGYGGFNSLKAPRSYHPVTVVSNTSTQAVLRWDSCEPMYLSPFVNFSDDYTYFANLTVFTISNQLTISNVLWNHMDRANFFTPGNGPSVATNIVTTINTNSVPVPLLLLNTITLTQDQYEAIPQKITFPFNYPYQTALQFSLGNGLTYIPPNTTTTMNISNTQIGGCPKRVIFSLGKNLYGGNYPTPWTVSQSFLQVLRINQFSWNNTNSQLTGLDDSMIYDLCVENGLTASWQQVSSPDGLGLPALIIDPGKDVVSGVETIVPGRGGNISIQVVLTVKNTSTQAGDNFYPICNFAFFSDGLFQITSPTEAIQNPWPLTAEDVTSTTYSNDTINSKTIYDKAGNWFGAGLVDMFSSMGSALVGGRRRRHNVRIEDEGEGAPKLEDKGAGASIPKEELNERVDERKKESSKRKSKVLDKVFRS